MDKGAADRRLTDRGISSVQFLLASALAMALFMAFANLVIVQYGRGAMQSALDQGARAGSLAGSTSACEATASEVIGQLLGGRMGDTVLMSCSAAGGFMVATGSAVFDSWTPMTSDFTVTLSGRAFIERRG